MAISDALPTNSSGSRKPTLDPRLLTVYSTRMSPFCQRARLLLNAKSVPFQVVNINIWDKPEWFLGITPTNKVPTVVEPSGRTLSESLIVGQYLDDEYRNGYKQFLPSDPYQRALELFTIDQVMQIIADPVRNVAMKGDKPAGEQLIKALQQVNNLLTNEYFAGKKMGFVDLMVYPWFDRSPAYLSTVDIDFAEHADSYSNLAAWRDRMLKDPAVRDSSYPDECYVASIQSRRSGKPITDVALDIQIAKQTLEA